MSTLRLKYQLYRRRWMPIIPIKLKTSTRTFQAEGSADSGAFYSLFQMHVARDLGLNLADGKKRLVVVCDGGLMRVYVFTLIVQVIGESFPADIAFSERLGVGFNLIGRKGIFDHFDEVVFRQRRREIECRFH